MPNEDQESGQMYNFVWYSQWVWCLCYLSCVCESQTQNEWCKKHSLCAIWSMPPVRLASLAHNSLLLLQSIEKHTSTLHNQPISHWINSVWHASKCHHQFFLHNYAYLMGDLWVDLSRLHLTWVEVRHSTYRVSIYTRKLHKQPPCLGTNNDDRLTLNSDRLWGDASGEATEQRYIRPLFTSLAWLFLELLGDSIETRQR